MTVKLHGTVSSISSREKRDREHAQQEILICMSEEVEELREVRFSEAKLCECGRKLAT